MIQGENTLTFLFLTFFFSLSHSCSPKAAQGSGPVPDQICVSVSHVSPEDMLNIQIIQHPCPPYQPTRKSFVRRIIELKGMGNNKSVQAHSREANRAKNNRTGLPALLLSC